MSVQIEMLVADCTLASIRPNGVIPCFALLFEIYICCIRVEGKAHGNYGITLFVTQTAEKMAERAKVYQFKLVQLQRKQGYLDVQLSAD
jgi:hypothetical protein